MEQVEQQQEQHKLYDFSRASSLVAVDIDLTRDKSPWRKDQFVGADDSDTRGDSGNSREAD